MNPLINYLRLYKGFVIKKFVLVIVVLSMLGSLVACSGEMPATDQAHITPTLSPMSDWLVRWLNEPVCQPPCWENITPGKTSFADALTIAKNISGFKLGHIDDNSIQLKYNQGSVLLLAGGDANIQEMDLDTNFTSLELGEIVDRYGFADEMIKYGLPSPRFFSLD